MAKKKTVTIKCNYWPMWKRMLYWFAKGFFFAFVPMFSTFATKDPSEWTTTLVVSMFVSGLSGGLSTVYQYVRKGHN